MKFLYSIILMISFSSFADGATYSLLDDKLKMSVSKEMELLSPKVLKKRYGSQKLMPYAAFSDDKQSATLTITQYATPADKLSMKKLRKAISNMLRKSTPDATWKKDKLNTAYGTKVGVFEYEINGVGKYAYNITYAFPVNGQLTFVTFLTTNKKFKNKWRDVAREAFESIELTD